MRTSTLLAALSVTALALTGCSTESEMRAQDPAAATPTEVPTQVPTAMPRLDGQVATRGLVTVLDDGDGPELCHAVAESMPPQCSGPEITGWDWAAHPEHEDQGGVRWGSFHLTGTFDGATFAVGEAIPAALYDAMNEPQPEPLGTPCAEPDGGWVVDEARRSPEDLDATLNAAAALPGYAMAWLDDQVVNVAVTEDTAGAEATLRETWGGPLCISGAELSEGDLQAMQAEINKLPGLLTSGADRPDHVAVDVLVDDGSIQEWADATYGEGRVTVTSALVPRTAG